MPKVLLTTWICGDFQVMKEVQSALSTAAADDSKLVLLSAVGSVFCCGLDFIYFIRRLTDDRKRESTKMADAIRYVPLGVSAEPLRFYRGQDTPREQSVLKGAGSKIN